MQRLLPRFELSADLRPLCGLVGNFTDFVDLRQRHVHEPAVRRRPEQREPQRPHPPSRHRDDERSEHTRHINDQLCSLLEAQTCRHDSTHSRRPKVGSCRPEDGSAAAEMVTSIASRLPQTVGGRTVSPRSSTSEGRRASARRSTAIRYGPALQSTSHPVTARASASDSPRHADQEGGDERRHVEKEEEELSGGGAAARIDGRRGGR